MAKNVNITSACNSLMHLCIYLLHRKADSWIALPNFTKFPHSAPQEYLQTNWKDYDKKKKISGTEIKNDISGEPEVLINFIAISDVPTSKYLLLTICCTFCLLQ